MQKRSLNPDSVQPGQIVYVRERGTQLHWWIIALSLAVIAFHSFSSGKTDISAPAYAQSGAGARGVFAFSGPLTKNSYGVYMVDVDTGTIWVYEYISNTKVLRLAAARSWLYDRYLECHNCDEDSDSPLTPDAVRELVEKQRMQRRQSQDTNLQ